jgi:hypothetical protein
MNKHFAYLTQNDEGAFFQKVANDLAESRTPPASIPIVKTAMKNLLEGNTFDKIASRLDRDLYIIKTAGECGMNLGMQKRAGAYIDQVVEQCEMTSDEFDHLYEKVASEAILIDLSAARDHLSTGLSPELQPWLDGELAKIGHELTEGALMEKEALVRAIGGALKGLLGHGGAAVKAVAKAPGKAVGGVRNLVDKGVQGVRNWRIDRGMKSLAKTEQALANAEGSLAKLKAQSPTKNFRIREGIIEGMKGGQAATKSKVEALTNKNLAKYSPKAAPASAPTTAGAASGSTEAATAAKPPKPKRQPKAKTPKAEVPKTEASGAAADPAAKAEGVSDDVAAAAAGGGVTMKGAYEKARDKGWGALTGPEKQKLINAGVATVVGGRVILGHGILTGGEGIV